MKTLNLNVITYIHFIGIGGISMSGLALYLLSKGKKVSGSDIGNSSLIKNLQSKGAEIFLEHNKLNVKSNIELGVYSGAIKPNNPEIVALKAQGTPFMERSEFLGLLAKDFKNVISISGTHGKTTTTALIGEIFLQAGLNPTIHVGGNVVGSYNNFYLGDNNYFITEACEYKKSLEYLHSDVSVITNIEADHMDCYKDINDLYASFNVFAKKTKECVFLPDDKKLNNIISHPNKVLAGNKKSDYGYYDEKSDMYGNYSFKVTKDNKYLGEISLNIRGYYNIKNAILAIAVCDYYNIDFNLIKKALKEFKGVKRRNELMGMVKAVPVYADYAHHPTEIFESIKSFKKTFNKLLVVFQPHTYSRTIALSNEFKTCFKDASALIMFKTYPAREEYNVLGSEEAMFVNLKFKKPKFLAKNYNELQDLVLKEMTKYDAVLVLGAGDLYDNVNSWFNYLHIT